jgi:hypothetical protein
VWPERLASRLRPTRVPLVALGTNPTLSAIREANDYQCFVEKSRGIDDLAKILTMPVYSLNADHNSS